MESTKLSKKKFNLDTFSLTWIRRMSFTRNVQYTPVLKVSFSRISQIIDSVKKLGSHGSSEEFKRQQQGQSQTSKL